jgi:pheromone shutdown-related protein TraB
MNDVIDNPMVHRLDFEDKNILLLGTAHVSEESTQLVEKVLDAFKPDMVCVELCESRYQTIDQQNRWQNMDIVKVIKEKKAFLLLANLLLAAFQKRIAKRLGVTPGQEMLTAIKGAKACGAKIHLADRDIRVTLARAMRAMSLWTKIKLLYQIIVSASDLDEISAEDVEKMKQEDMLQMILADVGQSLPGLKGILIDERDQYLAHKIRTAEGQNILAVVGAGHVPGIKNNWDRPIDIEPLEEIPPKSGVVSALKWLLPMAILAVFVIGFFSGGKDTGGLMVTHWILANGIFAGLGAILALAHPLTILAGIFAAPLTSLNPMIAAGWVAGLVEIFARKPRVKDFEALAEDITSIKGFWRNKVTRILLVVVFTNLGSTIGTMVAIPFMIRLMAG